MTFFEYMMVMVSLIMALALSHLMRASSDILTGPKRYWVHTVWVFIFILWVLQGWWALWDQRTVSEWNLLRYLVMFLFPLLLFVVASILVPSVRSESTDWKAHFDEKRIWFFSAAIIIMVESIATPILVFDAPVLHPFRVFQLMMISVLIVGVMGKSQRTQGVVATLYLLLFLFGNYWGRLQLGGLATVSQ